jgi:Abortive infection bacteriophage resistance protein
MKFGKEFLTVDEQINLLLSKGLSISDVSSAKIVLLDHSYYEIVNGYRDPFLIPKNGKKQDKIFKEGAAFKELFALYSFDFRLRSFLLPYVLAVEEKVKTKTIYQFLNEKSSDGSAKNPKNSYLNSSSYDSSSPRAKVSSSTVIVDLKENIKHGLKKYPAFSYYQNKYGFIPLWVLATNMTFGEMSRFYEAMDISCRSRVARNYGLFENDFRTILKVLTVFRNCCAHGGRLYCFFQPYYLPRIKKDNIFIVPDSFSQRKFGSVLLCFYWLLSPKEFRAVINELCHELSVLVKVLQTINWREVLNYLGISPNMEIAFKIHAVKV